MDSNISRLADLETKVNTCLRLRLEFFNIWNMIIASHLSILMKEGKG